MSKNTHRCRRHWPGGWRAGLGDNGTLATVTTRFRGQPYPGGKGQRTANGTHVPLIANWPQTIPAARVNSDLVDSTDVLPTLCEAAGLNIPPGLVTDGHSFWPQFAQFREARPAAVAAQKGPAQGRNQPDK